MISQYAFLYYTVDLLNGIIHMQNKYTIYYVKFP